MYEIRNLGGYLSVDAGGFIINKASVDLIQEKWKPVVNEAVEAYRSHFDDNLIGIFVRGSVARGEAIDHLSDLDTIAVVHSVEETIVTPWAEDFNKWTIVRYPFVQKVEILAVTPEWAGDPKRALRIMLKTQSVCVFGEDISSGISPIKLGRDACQHFQSLQSEITDTINFFKYHWGSGVVQNQNRCSWIMKRILRTGFELVMEREQKYTRDLYPCFESFAHYYPEKRDPMYTTLELAINPTDKSDAVISLLHDWLSFMPVEIKRVFDFPLG